MPTLTMTPKRERDVKIVGGIAVFAGVAGYFLLHRSPAAAVATPVNATGGAAIPADTATPSALTGSGPGLSAIDPTSILGQADLSSALAAAVAAGQSQATAGILGTQASATPYVGNQVPAGAPANPTSRLAAAVVPTSNVPNPALQYAASPALAYQNPADLLSQIQAATAVGKSQVVLPSGEVWATNPETVALIQANIAANAIPETRSQIRAGV